MPPLVAEDMYGRGVVGRLLDLLDSPPLLTWKQLMTPLSVSVCVAQSGCRERSLRRLPAYVGNWSRTAVRFPAERTALNVPHKLPFLESWHDRVRLLVY